VLFALVAGLFLLDVVCRPDPVRGRGTARLGTLLVGSLRKRRSNMPPPAAGSNRIK